MQQTKTIENVQNNKNHLRKITPYAGAAVLLGAAALGFNKSHNHYGMNHSKNNAPTYLESHQGINPASVIENNGK